MAGDRHGKAAHGAEYLTEAEIAERLSVSGEEAAAVMEHCRRSGRYPVVQRGTFKGMVSVNGKWGAFERWARDRLDGIPEGGVAEPRTMDVARAAELLSVDEGTALRLMLLARENGLFGIQVDGDGTPSIVSLGPGGRGEFRMFISFARHALEHDPFGGVPWLTVDIREFAAACRDAIAACRHARELNRSDMHEGLMRYDIEVEAGGHDARIRLDLACALAKRADRLPLDAYGEEIACAMPTVDGSRWLICYSKDRQLSQRSPDVANIDHVKPRRDGGRTTLCNLQLMRTESNSTKGGHTWPDAAGEPHDSMRVLGLLRSGVECARSRAHGRLPMGRADDLDAIIDDELLACIEALGAGELAAIVLRSAGDRVARLVAAADGGRAARAAGAARAAAAGILERTGLRRTLVRAAADAVVAGRRAA